MLAARPAVRIADMVDAGVVARLKPKHTHTSALETHLPQCVPAAAVGSAGGGGRTATASTLQSTHANAAAVQQQTQGLQRE